MTKEKSDADLYGNECLRYEHLDGYPTPKSSDSCRGCKYSYDPNLYSPGCKHPDGCLERNQKNQDKKSCDQLTAEEKRHVNDILRKVNETIRTGHPPDVEYR